MLKKIGDRWVNVDVTLEAEVKESPGEFNFRSRVKDVSVEDAGDPSRMEGSLGILMDEVERELATYKEGQVFLPVFARKMGRLLEVSREEAWDLVQALCDRTVRYYINKDYLYRV